ncbi:TetR/AcrR family transcriptional regulator [Faecalicatena contorta]|uniref:TetR/AcrR family transcriptional regulator n=1 Tax=Faecalicatena contorta TaxID=39482 RepID=UPI001F3003B4|nr:TetR/AcrR family transcriptional regulator [Faecalicatena contorta]MCF2682632.1 TetR/AcrR family transcriptional regulator [Faecalicatena contorta]
MDETSQKIIDAAMSLVRDKGYVATTTKDIAREAGVNECTLFRKFHSKKDIVLSGMEQERWRGNLTPEAFRNIQWELAPDLEMFMTEYMNRITPEFVRLSIGLRAPQLYEEAEPLVMKVPQAFLSSLTEYFQEMERRGKLPHMDFECLALTIFSSTFGYTFLNASFEDRLFSVSRKQYIRQSVQTFIQGIQNQK